MEAFLHMMRAERGASHNTISAYAADLREISAFLATHRTTFLYVLTSKIGSVLFRSRGERPCGKLRRPQIVLSQALYAVPCRRRIAGRRSRPAYRWRQGKAEPARDIVDRRGGPSSYRSPRGGRSVNSGRRTPSALCLACLLELLYGTGLRVSELVSLPRSALRGDRMMLPVKGQRRPRTHPAAEPKGAR